MDARFARVKTDPRFKKIAKKQFQVKIDKRFEPMFNDAKFEVSCRTFVFSEKKRPKLIQEEKN